MFVVAIVCLCLVTQLAVINAQDGPTTSVSACGIHFNGSSGNILSPGYPLNYAGNLYCINYITVDPGHLVMLSFSAFRIEDCNVCTCDYVEVYDGDSTSANLLAKLCGRTLPKAILSTGNNMTVTLVTDYFNQNQGFNASYTQVKGTHLTGTSGNIMSPDYPHNYTNNLNLNNYITVDLHHRIVLSFSAFNLESSTDCIYDYVEVYDGYGTSANRLAKHCGSTVPEVITSLFNTMNVTFVTDCSATDTGFIASYTQVPVCGRHFNGSSGNILSPDYPLNYASHLYCSSYITVAPGHHVMLSFSTFDIETCNDCICDYVEVFDGDRTSANLLAKHCGYTVPGNITSTGNTMTVTLVTDGSGTYTGFNASYTQVP